ncbi:MAG: TolC family protein [Myxococcota bacterium]
MKTAETPEVHIPCILWLLPLPPASALAQPLSLDEALSLAVVHHPEVVETGLMRDQARAAVLASRAAFDPAVRAAGGADRSRSQFFVAGFPSSADSEGWTASLGVAGTTSIGTAWSLNAGVERDVTTTLISLTGTPQEQEQATWSTTVDVSVTQDVLAFLRSSAQANQVVSARERLDLAELTVLSATEAAVVEVADGWWAWWAAEADAQVARQAEEQSALLLTQTQARFEEGQVPRVEVARVESDRLSAERQLLLAEARVRSAADALLVAIGLEPGSPIAVVGDERVGTVGVEDSELAMRAAMDANLGLAVSRRELVVARRALDDAREVGIPSLDLTVRAGLTTLTDTAGDAFTSLGNDGNNAFVAGALGLVVPLGGRAARAACTEAEAGVDLAQVKLDAAMRELRAAVRRAIDQAETAAQGVGLAERRVAVARTTEDAEQARVDEGVRRLDALLDARTIRQSAEADLVAARVDRARAELQLARLQGRLLPEVLRVE